MHKKHKKSLKRKKQLAYRKKTGTPGKQEREWSNAEKKNIPIMQEILGKLT